MMHSLPPIPRTFSPSSSTSSTYGTTVGRILYFFPKRVRLLRNALVGRRSYGHPFEISWFSCAPYKYGDKVAKYKLLSIWPKSEPDRGDPNYLRKRLTETPQDPVARDGVHGPVSRGSEPGLD